MNAATLPAGVDTRGATALLFSSEANAETFSAISTADLCAIVCAEHDRCGGNLAAALANMWFELAQYPDTAPRHYNDCVIAASRITGVRL